MRNNKKLIIYLVIGICLIVLFLVSNSSFKEEAEAKEEVIEIEIEIEEDIPISVKVDIKGAVNNPGVYEVSSTSRVIDVIELAGGLKKSANTEYINLAKLVEDEMIIWVYTNSEIKKFKESNIKYEYIEVECNCPNVETSACITDTENGKININSATKEELMTLPGVGESKAISIIEYRTKTPFKTIEDIKNVSGIGDSAFDQIKDYITV